MNYTLLEKVVYLYKHGVNVSQAFKGVVSEEDFRLALKYVYDLQSGTYTKHLLEDSDAYNSKVCLADKISEYVSGLDLQSVCEAGIGEGTSFSFIKNKFPKGVEFYGFDMSLSRLAAAKVYFNMLDDAVECNLFVGELERIPFADNSVDLIYTVHALEPNGGREREIINELYRCTSRYLLLVEPDFERANNAQKARMERFGYVKNIYHHLENAGFRILDYSPLGCDINPENRASIYFAEKVNNNKSGGGYICPLSFRPLERCDGYYICHDTDIIYPIIDGIPLLSREYAIFFPQEYKSIIDSSLGKDYKIK